MTAITSSELDKIFFPGAYQSDTQYSDTTLTDLMDRLPIAKIQSLHQQLLAMQQPTDCSTISSQTALKWLALASEKTLTINSEVFPFPKQFDVPPDDLVKAFSGKTRLELLFVQLNQQVFNDIMNLLSQGRLLHLKLQGGFQISDQQVDQLISALKSQTTLQSLHLQNLRLSTEQMIKISLAIPKCPQIITLTLKSSWIHPKAVKPLKEMIEKSPHVKEFAITLDTWSLIAELHSLFEALKEGQRLDLSENSGFSSGL